MSGSDEWIWIPNWDGKEGFQHYKNRDPVWVKNYTRLLSKDEYRELSMHCRGILHSIWMAYATSNRQLRGSTLTLSRQLGQRVVTRDLVSLCDAGFIEIVASSVLATRLQDASPHARPRVRERREEKEQTTNQAGLDNSPLRDNPELSAYDWDHILKPIPD